MRIVNISLQDFRAFPGDFELPLNNGYNLLLHGENGSGKSSLAVALREFLSLEPTFPRPVDAYVHAFPLPPDPATGIVPPRSAHVILQFDNTNPHEVIRWQPGHLHPLQLDDGVTPASTTISQREALVGVSRRSGIFRLSHATAIELSARRARSWSAALQSLCRKLAARLSA